MGQTLSTYTTELITEDAFDRYWPLIDRELDRVPHIWKPWYTKEGLRLGALNNEFRIWGVGPHHEVHFVVFTRILQYEASKTLQLFLAFGNNIEKCIPALTATLEKLANANGCTRCEIVGRLGWGKLLPDFKLMTSTFSKELEPFKVQ